MNDSMRVEINTDGSATAMVGTIARDFPDMNSAVEWATKMLYGPDLEGESVG
jgi:hypothetical protein